MCTHVLFLQTVRDFCGHQMGNSFYSYKVCDYKVLKVAKSNDFPFF